MTLFLEVYVNRGRFPSSESAPRNEIHVITCTLDSPPSSHSIVTAVRQRIHVRAYLRTMYACTRRTIARAIEWSKKDLTWENCDAIAFLRLSKDTTAKSPASRAFADNGAFGRRVNVIWIFNSSNIVKNLLLIICIMRRRTHNRIRK